MQTPSGPRIRRGPPPDKRLTDSNYRKGAWEALQRDFESRCAYSMQHSLLAGGDSAMEVDHFDPGLSGAERNDYENLMLTTRFCNLAKGDRWPTGDELALGIRFLNPCQDMDYGVHIFEDPLSHELVGASPAGKWHIRMLLLNAPHFVEERRTRGRMRSLREKVDAELSRLERIAGKERMGALRELLLKVEAEFGISLELMIPDIPPPPGNR